MAASCIAVDPVWGSEKIMRRTGRARIDVDQTMLAVRSSQRLLASAGGGTRTRTAERPRRFKRLMSTNSITPTPLHS
jgi:hypothetical protein